MTLRMAVGTAIPLPEVEGPLIHLTEAQKKCPHENFHATVEVNRLSDSGRFSADVRINCSECDLPFVPWAGARARPGRSPRVDGRPSSAPRHRAPGNRPDSPRRHQRL